MFLADKLRGATIYRGWWAVGALFLSTSVYIGSSQYAFSLFIEPLEESFGWSRTQITASLSFSAVGAVAAPILGRIMDRYGARPVVLASLILLALSFLFRPLMSELWHWYGLSILQFIGMSAATTLPIGRLVGIWFRRTRGRVIGLTSMGNNFGGLFIPPMVAAVLTTASWQAGGYMVLAAVALLVLIFALFAIREYPPESEAVADEALKEIAKNQTAPAVTLTGWTVSEALRSKTFYAITAVVLMGTFTYITILPQIIVHLRNEGVSVRDASVALARIHRRTGMDDVRTAEGGEGVTGVMIRARIWVDGRLAGGLQALLGAPMAAYSGCGEPDGGIGHGKRRSRTGLARVCGDVGLAGGSVADGLRQAGSGMARSRARARLNCSFQGQRRGRCRVNRRAERVIRPAKAKTRRLRVLVVTIC